MTTARDLQLTEHGKWEPFDFYANAPDPRNVDMGAYLEAEGWSRFITLGAGADYSSLVLATWSRIRDGQSEYLVEVQTDLESSDFLKVNNLPALMDLLARWAPAVQAATIADIAKDLNGLDLDSTGLVEIVAARAAWGFRDRLPELEAEARRSAAEARERRRKASE